MKKLIDRRDYEIYFLKVEKKRPDKKIVRDYLRANHPYFTKACCFYSKECVICGHIFEMITVFHKRPKRREFLSLKPLCTASEIIVNSSFAKKECVVQYDGEYIFFGDEPFSLYPGNPDMKCDYSINTKSELHEFAKKEKIYTRLFIKRLIPYLYILVICVAAAGTVLSFHGMNRWKDVNIKTETTEIQTIKTEVIKEELSFWDIFTKEITIVFTSGGIFREYYYNRNSIPSHNHIIYKSDPEKMSALLQNEHRFMNISYPQINLEKDEYLLRVQYSLDTGPIENPIESNNEMYREISNFRNFCTDNDWQLTDLRIDVIPVYQLRIDENTFSDFIIGLMEYCKDKQIEPKIFHVTNIADGKIIDIAFIESSHTYKTIEIDTTLLNSVFTRQTVTGKQFENKSVLKNVSKPNITSPNLPIIGKISADGQTPVIFSKTDSGKIIISGGDIP